MPCKILLSRFEDWKSAKSESTEHDFSSDGHHPRNARLSFREIFGHVGRGVQRGYERIRSLRKIPTFYPIGKKPEKELNTLAAPSKGKKPEQELESKKKILDPQGPFLQKWNKIFVLSCVIAVSLDPLFFYIPGIDGKNKCISLDEPLEIIACVLRTFTDIFHILRIIFQFRTGFIAPSSRVFGRGELVDDPLSIAKRYLSTYFIVDVLSILPLPQVYASF